MRNFTFKVNNVEYNWEHPYITGAQLHELSGIPPEEKLYLKVKDPWDDELIELQTEVNLARKEIEQFFSRPILDFRIDGKFFQWNEQYITGLQLRQLASLQPDEPVFLRNPGNTEDEEISQAQKVNLARPGIERFFTNTGRRRVVLIVNGTPKVWNKRKIDHCEVVELSGDVCSNDPRIFFTVTYAKGPHQNRTGDLVRGQEVFVKNKMVFNVTKTDRS